MTRVGEPHVIPHSVIQQVQELLDRLRQTVPFPCTMQEAYFGCVPDILKKWHDTDYFNSRMKPGQATNLVLAITVSEAASVLHITPVSEEAYLGVRSGEGVRQVFWIRPPLGVPVPTHGSTSVPFYLPEDHPHRAAICKWVGEAYDLDEEVDKAVRLVTYLVGLARDYNVPLRALWPELLNFVQAPIPAAPTRKTATTLLKEAKVADNVQRAKVLELLATSVLLKPEYELNAWVKFY